MIAMFILYMIGLPVMIIYGIISAFTGGGNSSSTSSSKNKIDEYGDYNYGTIDWIDKESHTGKYK